MQTIAKRAKNCFGSTCLSFVTSLTSSCGATCASCQLRQQFVKKPNSIRLRPSSAAQLASAGCEGTKKPSQTLSTYSFMVAFEDAITATTSFTKKYI